MNLTIACNEERTGWKLVIQTWTTITYNTMHCQFLSKPTNGETRCGTEENKIEEKKRGQTIEVPWSDSNKRRRHCFYIECRITGGIQSKVPPVRM